MFPLLIDPLRRVWLAERMHLSLKMWFVERLPLTHLCPAVRSILGMSRKKTVLAAKPTGVQCRDLPLAFAFIKVVRGCLLLA